jgi:hypothetical protein
VSLIELRLQKGMLEFLMAGFFLGILFSLSIMLNWYEEPVNFEAIFLLLILFGLFVSCFVLGIRATRSRKATLPIVY